MDLPSVAQETGRPCRSTGHPPVPEAVRKHLTGACRQLQNPIPTKNPVGRRRPPFPPAFRQYRNEGDT